MNTNNTINDIRNVCILAHVDHGKTTLADILLSSNGIVSQRTAGDLRYLDSRPDEQERGITMKSSVISLNYLYRNKLKEDNQNESENRVIINLIDSPGHVDFFGDVSEAIKLSDCAFIVVDLLEGVCSQTRAVINQAWLGKLQMILVLNKLDKFAFQEFQLDTREVYDKIQHTIETINHIIGELISLEIQEIEEKTDTILPFDYVQKNYDTAPFHPLKGNVVFCSAFHQWGFRIADFVNIYSEKLNLNKRTLYNKMWGDFYMNSKKEILKGAVSNGGRKNLFTQLILDPIWSVYSSLMTNDVRDVEKKLSKLNITISLNSARDNLFNIRQVFQKWLPLHSSLLDALVEKGPDPLSAITKEKSKLLVPDDKFEESRMILQKPPVKSLDAQLVVFVPKIMLIRLNKLEQEDNHDLVGLGRIYSGYIQPNIKVFVISPRFNPYKIDEKCLQLTPDDFTEGPIDVYEKNIDINNDAVNNIKSNDISDIHVMCLKNIYHFHGPDFILIEKGVSTGHIIGVGGLKEKTATKNVVIAGKCQLKDCRGLFNDPHLLADTKNMDNIMRVSIEPKKISHLNELQEALFILEKSDPSVRVSIATSGEMILHVVGEVHLEKCLRDLTQDIAPHIEVEVSNPIVPFRETITNLSNCDQNLYSSLRAFSAELKDTYKSVLSQIPSNTENQQGTKQSIVCCSRLPDNPQYRLFCRISVHTMPQCLIEWVDKNYTGLLQLRDVRSGFKTSMTKAQQELLMNSFSSALQIAKTEKQGSESEDGGLFDYSSLLPHYWSVGEAEFDQHNLLFGYVESHSNSSSANDGQWKTMVYRAIEKGFHRGMRHGPICQEPVRGVIVIIHDIWEENDEFNEEKCDDIEMPNKEVDGSSCGNVSKIMLGEEQLGCSIKANVGQISALVNNTCTTALMVHPGLRIMVALYKLEIEIRQNQFKSFKSLLEKCHGFIVQQDVVLGDFIVESRLPVIESLGFSKELRSRTSGLVGHPILRAISWSVIDCHPCLTHDLYREMIGVLARKKGNGTSSEETANLTDEFNEDIELDELVDLDSVIRCDRYVTDVRLRKGLKVRKQLVEFADKQRTLAKKK